MKFQSLVLFLLFVNLFTAVSFAQSDESHFYVAKKSHAYFVEIRGYDAFVFYGPVMTSNQVYFGKRVNTLDTLCYETTEYAGNRFHLSTINKNLYLIANPDVKHVPKKMELQLVLESGSINSDLNESYWFENYIKMIREIDTIFPHASFSMGTGWDEWNGFPNKESYYKDFRRYIDSLLPVYKDSLVQAHSGYTEILNALMTNILVLTADEVITETNKFPKGSAFRYNEYSATIINEIAEKRPGLFYEIAEKAGKDQEKLFLMVSKPAIKTLKSFETDSPAKKQFIKFRRHETFFIVSGITIATVGNAAFFGTIGYLIFR